MLFNVETTTPAFNRLKDNGLLDLVSESSEELSAARSNSVFVLDSLFDRARLELSNVAFTLPAGKREVFQEIFELEQDCQDIFDKWGDHHHLRLNSRKFLESPSFIARYVLGDGVFNFNSFGFSSRRNLELAIASYVISGADGLLDSSPTVRVWRNQSYKNYIHLRDHGDLWAKQVDISAEEVVEQTLFGEYSSFQSFTDRSSKGISADQDWSGFLVSALKYAEYLDLKDLPEITNWRSFLRSNPWGNAPSELEVSDRMDYTSNFLLNLGVFKEGQDLDSLPLEVRANSTVYFPYITKKDRLQFIKESEFGEVSLEGRTFSICLDYFPEDLPHILSANHALFARDRSLAAHIMEEFNK